MTGGRAGGLGGERAGVAGAPRGWAGRPGRPGLGLRAPREAVPARGGRGGAAAERAPSRARGQPSVAASLGTAALRPWTYGLGANPVGCVSPGRGRAGRREAEKTGGDEETGEDRAGVTITISHRRHHHHHIHHHHQR